jgi:hypothetical protein
MYNIRHLSLLIKGVRGMPGSSSVLMENAAAATVAAHDSTPLLES